MEYAHYHSIVNHGIIKLISFHISSPLCHKKEENTVKKGQLIDAIAVFAFQGYLLYLVSPSGQPAVSAILAAGFLAAALWLLWKRPLEGRLSNRKLAHLLYAVSIAGMILALIRAGDFIPALGAFAALPANLGLLAACLAGPMAVRPKEQSEPAKA